MISCHQKGGVACTIRLARRQRDTPGPESVIRLDRDRQSGRRDPGLWLALPRCEPADAMISGWPIQCLSWTMIRRFSGSLPGSCRTWESVLRTAADASQALIVAEDARPAAVLVDIGLPDRDGTDLAYELSDLPWRPRVVLTSSDSEAFLAIELRDGHRELAFIPKEELAGGTLRRALLDG